jgi:signal transduction histidine kinase
MVKEHPLLFSSLLLLLLACLLGLVDSALDGNTRLSRVQQKGSKLPPNANEAPAPLRTDSITHPHLKEPVKQSPQQIGQPASKARLRTKLWFLATIALLFVLAGLHRWLVVLPLKRELATHKSQERRQSELANLGTLAAGIAHEVRNPITAMKARIFALKELAGDNSSIVSQANYVDRELNRLESLVREFLSFARPSEPDLKWVAPSDLLEEFYESIRPEVEAAGNQCQLALKPAPKTRMDALQVRQILFNLLRNANEACEEGTGIIRLGIESDEHVTRIYVADNGPGIPEADHSRIFEPFFSKRASGTGLGLSIANNLAQRNGARLSFSSSSHTGTTFDLDFPTPTL